MNHARAVLMAAILFLLLAATPASATLFTYTSGSTDVSVSVLFGTNLATVVITNNTVGPNDVSQNVSGFGMTLSGGLTGTLTSVAGTLINIDSAGAVTSIAGIPDWFQPSPPTLGVTGLGASGPDNTLIGKVCQPSGTYSCSNGSIKGNGSHNPFANGPLTLQFQVLGATTQT